MRLKFLFVRNNVLRLIVIGVIGAGLLFGVGMFVYDLIAKKDAEKIERPKGITTTTGPDGVLAKVGNIEIPTADYFEELAKARVEALKANYDLDAQGNATALQATKEGIVEQLINNAVYENYAKENGLMPTEAEINKVVTNEIDNMIHDFGSVQAAEKELANLGGIEGARKRLKNDKALLAQLIQRKILLQLMKNVKVTKEEAKEFFNSKLLGLSQIVILYDEKIDGKENHDKLLAYAKRIREVIGDKLTFEDAAKTFSEERETGQNGGKFTELTYKGTLPKPLEDVAFKLKIGEVSDVIEVPGSFVTLKLDLETYVSDYYFTEGGAKPRPKFEDVYPKVVEQLYTIKELQTENEWFNDYKSKLDIQIYVKFE